MLRACDIPVGTVFCVRDKFDGEVRNTYYRRTDKSVFLHKGNVGVERLGFVQRNAYGEYRAVRFLQAPCRDPGEMLGLTPASLEGDFPEHLAAALIQ